MTMQLVAVPPIDPHSYTGPTRVLGGIGRSAAVVLDTEYGEFARAIMVATAGNVSAVNWAGVTTVLPNLTAGVWHYHSSIKINSAGTTATGILWGS